MIALNYWSEVFNQKLRDLLGNQLNLIGITAKSMAARCETSEGALWRYYTGQEKVFKTFYVLFNLCKGHKLDLLLYIGSKSPTAPAFSARYTGNISDFKKQLGKALIGARKSKGMNQRELSTYLGIDQSWINKIENGRGNNPKPQAVHELFAKLDAKLLIMVELPKAS